MPTAVIGKIRMNVVPDVGWLFNAVAAVRNVYVSPNDRRPLNFDVSENRSASRVPLCIPVTVHGATIEAGTAELSDESVAAEAIDIAVRGLSFSHDEPLPHKLCTVNIELPAGKSVTFLMS